MGPSYIEDYYQNYKLCSILAAYQSYYNRSFYIFHSDRHYVYTNLNCLVSISNLVQVLYLFCKEKRLASENSLDFGKGL